jgi:hypothetical protein
MAETEATLSKVDSATQQPEVKAKRRPSSMAADCYDILDLRKYLFCAIELDEGQQVRGSGADIITEKEGKQINISPETQKLGW